MTERRAFPGALLACALGAACAGSVGDSEPGEDRPADGGGSGGAAGSPAATAGTPAVGAGSGGLRRLTNVQYRNSIRDLLGAEISVATELEEDGSVDGSSALAASSLAISRTALERYETAALEVARRVFANPAARARVVPCVPAAPADEACARRFVQGFGQRAWRRPLTDEEVQPLVGFAATVGRGSGDAWLGLEMTLAALLQSPAFIYRIELGRPDAGRPARTRLDDWELATRLSYFLLETTPGDALLGLAQRGALGASLATEARRMLDDPRAAQAVTRIFAEALRVVELPMVQKNKTVFPRMSPTLGASMLEELRRLFLEYALERQGSVLDLHDTREVFANAELAALYGLPAPRTDFAAAMHPAGGVRAGLLTTAGFLAEFSFIDKTSPAARGKAIRENILCGTIPAPPGNVSTELPPPPAGQKQTMRQRLAAHASNPSCAGCHQLMDPLGLALETFDGIGVHRRTDQGLPIDTSGTLDGASFQDAAELSAAVRRHPALGPCLVRRLYRAAVGQIEGAAAEPLVLGLAKSFAAGGERFRSLAVELVAGDLFRYAEAAAP